MSEQKRIRIVSNGRTEGGTRVFLGDEDVSSSVTHVAWTIGVGEVARATVTFARAEIEVDYVATAVERDQPRTWTAPVSGRYHVVSGREPHLVENCTEECA